MTIFDDGEFRQAALRLGYMGIEELEECIRVQNRTVGRTVKSLELIALDRKFLTPADLERMREGIPLRDDEPQIPGYDLRGILGKGGLGTVYRARQATMKRDVALKVLHPRWVSDDEFRKRFLLEARIVGKLSHRNLIQVFDIGVHRGVYYFSMELVEGTTVYQELRNGPFDVSRSIDVAIQVADAIKCLAMHDLVHRDIKPSNVLLTLQDVAKLGDFGFVKCHLDKKLGNEDYILGTPDYISPEQALGDEGLDYRSDIYSLGATLYHMATGVLPYDGTESMVIKKHIRDDIPSPQTIVPDLSPELCQVIERMMAKHPDDRYSKIDELIGDLRLVKLGRTPGTAPLARGKSTIMQVLSKKTQRARQLTEEKKLLRKRLEGMEARIRFQMSLIYILSFLFLALLLTFIIFGALD